MTQFHKAFDLQAFQSKCSSRNLGRSLLYFKQVDSTMVEMDKLARNHELMTGTTILTDFQTQGIGRANRPWLSEKNANLLFTTFIRTDEIKGKDSTIDSFIKCNLAAAIAVCKVLRNKGIDSVGVKWPNDVWIGNQKVAGILVNTNSEEIHVGVGINVLEQISKCQNGCISRSGTSVLEQLQNCAPNTLNHEQFKNLREDLLADMFATLEVLLENSLVATIHEYKRYDILLGNQIIVMPKRMEHESSYFEATALDYEKQGFLVVRTNQGMIKTLSGEEVSVRPFLDRVFGKSST